MQSIYIFNLFSPFLYALLIKPLYLNKENKKNILLFLYFMTATLIVGTRTLNTGEDTISYYIFYQYASQPGNEISTFNVFEPLFSAIGIMCAKSGFDFSVFNIIIAALTMLFFSKAIKRASSEVAFSIFLYSSFSLVNNMMNQVRQALAMMIALYAVSLLQENRKTKFIMYILIASLVHMAALVMLLLLPLYKIKVNGRIIGIYAVITFIVMVCARYVLKIMSYLPYGNYLSESWRYTAFNKDAILNLIVRMIMLIFSLIFLKEIYNRNQNCNVYYHMILICTFFQVLAVANNSITRITTYFFTGYLIIIPEIFSNSFFRGKNKKISYMMFLAAFFVYYYVHFSLKNQGGQFYYESILF